MSGNSERKSFSIREKVVITRGDITNMDTEAIVNAANTDLVLGAGVAGAIRRKGGPAIQAECDQLGHIALGEAAITGGANLRARYVIHAASMGREGLTTESSLRDSVRNSLLRVEEKTLRTIAFPAIGTGVAGFPMDRCAEIMLGEVTDYLTAHPNTSLQRVYFVLFDTQAFKTFEETWERMK